MDGEGESAMVNERMRWAALAVGMAALGVVPIQALASGGGMSGGGGAGASMPSVSAPAYDPTVEYSKGIEALKSGKYHDADRYFSNVLSVAPDNANVVVLQGVAKGAAGDLKGSERAYEKALKMEPDNILARRESAKTLAMLGQPDKAQAQLDMLKKRMASCGDTCPDAADLKSAVAAVETAMAPPAAPPAGTPPATDAPATKTPASLLLGDPASGDRSYVQAVHLINEKRYADALVALHHASDVFGPHPDVLTYIGYTYRKMGDYDRAEHYYKEALKIAPNHVGATEYYGELMVVRGDVAGARKMLAKLDTVCTFGCVEQEDLRRWIDNGPPAS
jgi:Flp pilus assembly protein TadD